MNWATRLKFQPRDRLGSKSLDKIKEETETLALKKAIANATLLFLGGVSDVHEERARYLLLVRFAINFYGQAQSFLVDVANVHASLVVE